METYLISLALFAIASTGTPGPNNLMILTSGLNFGIPKSIPHWLGICTGVPFMIFAVGLGLDQLFRQWPMLFMVLKVLGVGYLLYLAFKIATTETRPDSSKRSQPMTYLQGALFQWVNPKAWVMVLSAVTAFTSPDSALLPQIAIIAMVFMMIGLCCVGCWLFAGSQLQRLLKNAKQQRFFNRLMSALLVASIVPMAFVGA